MKRLINFQNIYDSNIDIEQHVVRILAVASSVANTIGFLANFFLYGINFPTAVCGICAILCWLHLFFGSRSRKYMLFGSVHLIVLCVLEFPLLVFAYGPVMYPYMILGYMGVLMLSREKVRLCLCTLLTAFDLAVIAMSSIFPYVFGPQDSIGLMGSALITFLVTIIAFSICIIVWQNVYVRRTSDVDPETGVLSREGFIREAGKMLQGAPAGKYAIVFFNIVNFKTVNAIYGIEGGNLVLKQLAQRLNKSSMLRPHFACRNGADHFYILVDEKNIDYSSISKLCQFKYRSRSMDLSLQLNCGIYVIDDSRLDISLMCDRAKAVVSYSPMIRTQHFALFDKNMEEELNKENSVLAMVEEAMVSQAFEPYYQPVVDCMTGEIVSAEALARWIRPDGKVVPPGVFIPVLEKREMISELDGVIISKTSRFLESRYADGKTIRPVSMNLSRVDLYKEDLMNNLEIMVKKSRLPKTSYRFEITESAYEAIPENVSEALSKLRELGAWIMMDDFGSGYSSLGTITEFALDVIKLDMSFARKIEKDQKVCNVIRFLIEMSHDIGFKVVAEGVETEAQLEFLRSCGCDYVQGYYFYKPMPEAEYAALLDKMEN